MQNVEQERVYRSKRNHVRLPRRFVNKYIIDSISGSPSPTTYVGAVAETSQKTSHSNQGNIMSSKGKVISESSRDLVFGKQSSGDHYSVLI